MPKQPMQGGMMPPDDQAPAPDQPAEGQDPGQGQDQTDVGASQPASPEEQQAYNDFMNNCMTAIYGDGKRIALVMKSLGASNNFVLNLADTTAHIVVAVEVSAKKAGKQFPDEAVTQAGEDVMKDLAEMSKRTGIHTFTDKELEQAALQGVDRYRELGTAQGVVDANALKQQFGAQVQADQAQNGGGAPAAPGAQPAAPPGPPAPVEGQAA